MDMDKVLNTLFPHAEILSGIFGTNGQGGFLNNLLGVIPQAAHAVAPGGVPAIMNAAAPGGVPGVVNSVAPGGVPGVVNSVIPGGVPAVMPGYDSEPKYGVYVYGDSIPVAAFRTFQEADRYALTIPASIPVQILPLDYYAAAQAPVQMPVVSGYPVTDELQ